MKSRPQILHHSQQQERKATWLELFFDLSLVVPIFQLSHYLVDHLSFMGVVGYVILFMAVLQVWMHNVYYHEQFELPEKTIRIITLLKILLLICMTSFIPTALGDGKLGFVLSFCAVRILITGLWEWSAYHNPPFRDLTRKYSRGTILGTVIFLLSLWAPEAWTIWMWLSAIVLDTALPALMMRHNDSSELSRSDHLPERFGLFFLILLGESIISITSALLNPEHSFSQVILAAVLGILLVFGIWWLYIDTIMAKPINRDSSKHVILWQQGHMALFLALPGLGASILLLLNYGASASAILFIAIVLAVILLSLGIIERGLIQSPCSPCQKIQGLFWRMVAVVVVLLIIFAPNMWTVWMVFLLLNVIVWGQVLVAERMVKIQD